ncbi:F-box protein At3g44326-like [Apium graveolens]|uniref:F-box protein At3g44326-like n=1 Tax=Apium graveolens TaxID=4045 RepID=UPI003D7A8F62
MASSSLNQGAAAAAAAAGTTITALHSDIIVTHLLTKFDGQSLASAASTCRFLSTLCNNESLWENISNSTWNSIKHPLVQQTISSFPGGYRSFYSDSFPVMRPSISQGSVGDEVDTSELISAVDIHYGNNSVYSKVTITNTESSSFPGSLFNVDLVKNEEKVEIPVIYEGDENECMSNLEENLRLSWIVIGPTLKRAGNVSSLRPVSIRPHWDGTGIKVTYATVVSGACCGIDTTEFVECKIVAFFGCEEGKKLELKELSLCVVDMVKTRLNGQKSLKILKGAMESGERKKENGDGKRMYVKYLNLKRHTKDDNKTRQDKVYRVLWVLHAIIWVLFAISLITSLC